MALLCRWSSGSHCSYRSCRRAHLRLDLKFRRVRCRARLVARWERGAQTETRLQIRSAVADLRYYSRTRREALVQVKGCAAVGGVAGRGRARTRTDHTADARAVVAQCDQRGRAVLPPLKTAGIDLRSNLLRLRQTRCVPRLLQRGQILLYRLLHPVRFSVLRGRRGGQVLEWCVQIRGRGLWGCGSRRPHRCELLERLCLHEAASGHEVARVRDAALVYCICAWYSDIVSSRCCRLGTSSPAKIMKESNCIVEYISLNDPHKHIFQYVEVGFHKRFKSVIS